MFCITKCQSVYAKHTNHPNNINSFCIFAPVTSPTKKALLTQKKSVKKKTAIKRKSTNRYSLHLKLVIAGIVLILLSPFYYGYVIKGFTSTWRWIRDFGGNPRYHTYKSFNIPIPDKYSIHGIDVSSYQGKIDWQRVKDMHEDSVHISFAFIKATEGVLLVDPYFQRNWRECPKAGITCGAYHYFRPKFSGKWQARFFLQNVKAEKGDLPMVLDVERLDGMTPDKMRQEVTAFLKEVEAKTKSRPIIYSGLQFYQDNLAGYFNDYTLWIAHYYQSELTLSKKTTWKFWQHSDKAKVNGINHVVDFDVFNGDSLSFKNLLIR
ncbi:MAG: lysozyme [Mucilaginibacter sp.]|nr:lysozyme [Mucilaginibacter sp.]